MKRRMHRGSQLASRRRKWWGHNRLLEERGAEVRPAQLPPGSEERAVPTRRWAAAQRPGGPAPR